MTNHISRYRAAIVGFKIITGVIEVISGILLTALSDSHINQAINSFVTSLTYSNPQTGVILEKQLRDLASHKTTLAFLFIAFGIAKIIGAIGFYLNKSWGYYVMISVLLGYLPYDGVMIIKEGSLFTIMTAILDIVILSVMVYHRRSFLHAPPSS
jgi:uncharacterized membrane protein